MSDIQQAVTAACSKYASDRSRMLDIVREVQDSLGHVPAEALDAIAAGTKASRVEVESVVSFYAFLNSKPKGKVVIRLCNDIIDEMAGGEEVKKAFERELGIKVNESTPDGKMHLEETPFIGMGDQAPAAMINDVIVTKLTVDGAREIAKKLKEDPDPTKLTTSYGNGNNGHELIKSMVDSNLMEEGRVLFGEYESGAALKKTVTLNPADIIRNVKTSRLRGRGGAGFPTGMKWDFTQKTAGDDKYLICNADEGEPGTFKDRVLLTERADLLFEGMAVAAYAVGAKTGILYLRAEYAYLREYLESVLAKRRDANLLGNAICGKEGFDFDIRIQMGAGAYICGEETALISSCEGVRGDPKNRPPFPVEQGYMAKPTCVNNVETLCCVPSIVTKGPGWFAGIGSRDQFGRDTMPIPQSALQAPKGTAGTKLLSVSGDCTRPGVYEVGMGIAVSEFLAKCGGLDAAAVQIGGPSGQMISPAEFGRTICYDDLATGGSVMVFGKHRNLLRVVSKFLEFFIEESCGFCTPCRVGNVLLKEYIDRIAGGKANAKDLEDMEDLANSVKMTSRCGLGQTSPNPVLGTFENFRFVYNALIKTSDDGSNPSFDLAHAVRDAEVASGRRSVHN